MKVLLNYKTPDYNFNKKLKVYKSREFHSNDQQRKMNVCRQFLVELLYAVWKFIWLNLRESCIGTEKILMKTLLTNVKFIIELKKIRKFYLKSLKFRNEIYKGNELRIVLSEV